jgi:cbb3-type cytochrome oxidase cytochrome c subunit
MGCYCSWLNLFQKTPKIDDEVGINIIGITEEDFIYEGNNLIHQLLKNISKETYDPIKEKLWKRLYPLIISITQKQFVYETDALISYLQTLGTLADIKEYQLQEEAKPWI